MKPAAIDDEITATMPETQPGTDPEAESKAVMPEETAHYELAEKSDHPDGALPGASEVLASTAWRHALVVPKAIVEAALLAAGQPLTLQQLSSLFSGDDAPGSEEVAAMIAELIDETAGRGIELVEVASGWRYQIRRDVYLALASLWQERPVRYSRALLETLALIAYRQPITRGEIENVRGVSVSTQIIRTLEERDWIHVVGHRDLPGKPALYGTTRTFLDDFNLKSLSELPPLAEIVEIDKIEPELNLEFPNLAAPSDETADGDEHDLDLETGTPGRDNPAAGEPEPQTAPESLGAAEVISDDEAFEYDEVFAIEDKSDGDDEPGGDERGDAADETRRFGDEPTASGASDDPAGGTPPRA